MDTIVLTFERIGEACTRCLCIERSSAKFVRASINSGIERPLRQDHQELAEPARVAQRLTVPGDTASQGNALPAVRGLGQGGLSHLGAHHL